MTEKMITDYDTENLIRWVEEIGFKFQWKPKVERNRIFFDCHHEHYRGFWIKVYIDFNGTDKINIEFKGLTFDYLMFSYHVDNLVHTLVRFFKNTMPYSLAIRNGEIRVHTFHEGDYIRRVY